MKQSTKFLKEKLEDLANNMLELKIRYEYRSTLRLHIVEVLPIEYFESDFNYVQREMKIEQEFEKMFEKLFRYDEQESILFVSEVSLISVDDPQLSFGY